MAEKEQKEMNQRLDSTTRKVGVSRSTSDYILGLDFDFGFEFEVEVEEERD